MVVSTAGHPPPIMAVPNRPGVLLALPADLPVGLALPKPRRSTLVDLPHGSTVVAYTDGLVERRGENIDAGLERLTGQVWAGPAEPVCTAIMAGMDVGSVEDDIALLAIHRLP
jgi:serine phosphatase RsbU (regulator of sigma subunit)